VSGGATGGAADGGAGVDGAVKPGALARLKERGFFQQCTDEDRLREKLDSEPITFYVGIDPTGTSLHVGHLVPIYAMAHLAEFGHRPIVVMGGGTARIGDPSGKIEMRKMISVEEINANAERMGVQIDHFLGRRASSFTMVNNAEWLAELNYIDFLREIGRHFSVNRMLSFETYKMRLETGLSFIEFNYQLLQSYDFLKLYQTRGCSLQIGGDDQWGNIVAGADLIRRIEGSQAESFGLTFPLVTRADGKKMGKTEKGAVFLDPAMVTPYDFFQYWRNVPDDNVRTFLLMYTFLNLDEIEPLLSDINGAKERLALEITTLIHGEEEANKALEAARSLFAGGGAAAEAVPSGALPTVELDAGILAVDLFVRAGLSASKGEARRLIQQGGARINDRKVESIDGVVDSGWAEGDPPVLLLKAGKKRYYRFDLQDG